MVDGLSAIIGTRIALPTRFFASHYKVSLYFSALVPPVAL